MTNEDMGDTTTSENIDLRRYLYLFLQWVWLFVLVAIVVAGVTYLLTFAPPQSTRPLQNYWFQIRWFPGPGL
jgi:uncharacterized protein involved in exopolysaccharide biosynthesis